MAATDRERMTLQVTGRVERDDFTLDVALDVADGEVVAVLGPNGAGKSTLLAAVAGLIALDSGRITLRGQVLDEPTAAIFVPPAERCIGVVFQDHRLFPHLRVADNVAFGARSRGIARQQAQSLAEGWLERFGIGALARRRPRELSGGQAQRVALARALAMSPHVLLLDEPLAALDVQTRAEVQGELRRHLADYAGPTVLVTHDPVEALLLSTRIVVLERGAIVQQGSASEITNFPLTPYVARLVGMNLYRGTSSSGVVRLDDGGELSATDAPDGPVLAAIRPSAFTVHTSTPVDSSARNIWPGTISSLAPLADRIRLHIGGARDVLVDVSPAAVAELALHPGTQVWLTAKATDLVVYPAPPS